MTKMHPSSTGLAGYGASLEPLNDQPDQPGDSFPDVNLAHEIDRRPTPALQHPTPAGERRAEPDGAVGIRRHQGELPWSAACVDIRVAALVS